MSVTLFKGVVSFGFIPLSGVSVQVTAANVTVGSGATSSLFSDSAGTIPLSNPMITAADGSFMFYAANGNYDLGATLTGYSTTYLGGVSLPVSQTAPFNIILINNSGVPLFPSTARYQTVEINGSVQTQRAKLDIVQSTNITVSVTDDPSNDRTIVTLSATGGGGGGGGTGLLLAVVSKSASYAPTSSDEAIEFTTGSSTCVCTFPAGAATGKEYIVKKVDSGTGKVTVNATAANVDGASEYDLVNQNQYVRVYFNGSNWSISANN